MFLRSQVLEEKSKLSQLLCNTLNLSPADFSGMLKYIVSEAYLVEILAVKLKPTGF
jgi:hypothetical protein|tara:strand:- start:8926 stop:9093 length:168 start_codon:yes stop_codon:yes gene_type:complete